MRSERLAGVKRLSLQRHECGLHRTLPLVRCRLVLQRSSAYAAYAAYAVMLPNQPVFDQGDGASRRRARTRPRRACGLTAGPAGP